MHISRHKRINEIYRQNLLELKNLKTMVKRNKIKYFIKAKEIIILIEMVLE